MQVYVLKRCSTLPWIEQEDLQESIIAAMLLENQIEETKITEPDIIIDIIH